MNRRYEVIRWFEFYNGDEVSGVKFTAVWEELRGRNGSCQ